MAHLLPTNITSMYRMFTYVNMVTDYWFGPLMLIAVWFVSFIALKRYDYERAWLGSSTICALVAIPMRIINLVNETTLIIFVSMALVSLIFKYWKSTRGEA